MSSPIEKVPMEPSVAPLNFIFACSLCGASFADIYEGHDETVLGLSDGINPKDRLVTRLFLANCSHVFCSGHLEGGGAPFHSAKERPRAPCPVCVKDKGNHEPQFLYSVRGFNRGEYDPLIPPSWFISPPLRLDCSGKEMDALRFQYIALIRYCQKNYATRKPLEQALTDSERKLGTMRKLASEEHAKVLSLKKENEQLQMQLEALQVEVQRLQSIEQKLEQLQLQKDQFEAMKAEVKRLQSIEQKLEHFRNLNVNPRDLETFLKNKSAIRHYLNIVPMLMDQNEKMQKRLGQLGFAMPLEPIPNFKGDDPSALDSYEALRNIDDAASGAMLQKTASSHTAGRSTHASGRVGTTSSSPFAQRPMKRQRLDSPLPKNVQIEHPSGRHEMPPPAKPLSRMQSMRSIFPGLRKKFSTDRSSPVVQGREGDDRNIQIIQDNGRCQTAKSIRQHVRDVLHGEPQYMSGALPVEKPSELSDLGSPQRVAQLSAEPSYIRLMDVLSNDNEVELELKDPRENSCSGYQGDNMKRQVVYAYKSQPGLQGEERWGSGHDAFHQASNKSSVSSGTYCHHPQYEPTDMYANRDHNQPDVGHATPASERHYLGNPIDTVFKSFRDLSVSKATEK
ncbi:uncharacterized protein yc1106_03966 [Curvularia clavata]|uniref:Uncharacterized protein n=1 Tax=Curvularia clavata TaxID=95742 RepID=A0A9Q8Z5G8_CURCL|nr:uncharacterized protein yc1106_03966 [Curvularia clavata]